MAAATVQGNINDGCGDDRAGCISSTVVVLSRPFVRDFRTKNALGAPAPFSLVVGSHEHV